MLHLATTMAPALACYGQMHLDVGPLLGIFLLGAVVLGPLALVVVPGLALALFSLPVVLARRVPTAAGSAAALAVTAGALTIAGEGAVAATAAVALYLGALAIGVVARVHGTPITPRHNTIPRKGISYA